VTEPVLQQGDRLQQLRHAVHREVAGLEGHDHLLGCPQCVEGEDAHVRGAIDQGEVVGDLEASQRIREAFGATPGALCRQLLLERRQDDARGGHIQVVGGRQNDVFQWGCNVIVFGQDLVEILIDLIGVDAQSQRRVGLGIHVDDEDPVTLDGETSGETDRRRRLPATALLVHDSYGAHTLSFPSPSMVRFSRREEIA